MALRWSITPPSPFAPRSEMLAFLKECEPDKDHPDVKAAAAKVQGYLDADDRKAALARKTSPSPKCVPVRGERP
jgi:hypothetical protein